MTQLQRSVHPLQQLLEQHDALLTPTVAEPPPPLGFDRPSRFHAMISQLVGRLPIGPQLRKQSNLDQVARETFRFMPFTPLFNITGQPSMSVPLCWNVEGLPIGVMLSARRGADGELLRLGAQLEEAFPWEGRSPPLSA